MQSVLISLALATTLVLQADADLQSQVQEQVERLGANTLSERNEAEKALIKLGPSSLAHLPEVEDRFSPEVVQRLARVRQALEQVQVDQAAKPTLVTLIGEDLPLEDVIARISQQTSNKIADYREEFGEEAAAARISVDLDKVEFWKAMDEVLDKAQLTTYDFAGERGLFLVNRPSDQRPRKELASYAGPFRLEAVRFETLRELRRTDGGALRLFLNVSWEPRLRPIAIRQPLDEVKVVGSGDMPIAVANAEGEPEASVSDDSAATELQIALELPPRNVEKIISLKGKLEVMVPGPMEEFRFDQLPIVGEGAKAQVAKVEKRKAGVTVTVDQVRKNNDVWEVRTRIRFDKPGDSLESHRSWLFRNELYLVGSDKKRILPGAYEQTRQTDDEVGVAYLFDLPNGPAGMTFVYETPTKVFEMPVEYELRDLELP